MSSTPESWLREGERALLHTRVFDVQAVRFRHPRRTEGREFIAIDAPDWVVVLPVTANGELLLVRQFRFGVAQLSLELPGGVIEPGEAPVDAAARELAEETGYRGGQPELIGTVHPNPAIQRNRAHLVVIPNVVLAVDTAWDADEELSLERMPIPAVLELARGGGITHALMLNGLFMLEGWWARRKAAGGDAV